MDERVVKKAIVLMFLVPPRRGESVYQYVARAERQIRSHAASEEVKSG